MNTASLDRQELPFPGGPSARQSRDHSLRCDAGHRCAFGGDLLTREEQRYRQAVELLVARLADDRVDGGVSSGCCLSHSVMRSPSCSRSRAKVQLKTFTVENAPALMGQQFLPAGMPRAKVSRCANSSGVSGTCRSRTCLLEGVHRLADGPAPTSQMTFQDSGEPSRTPCARPLRDGVHLRPLRSRSVPMSTNKKAERTLAVPSPREFMKSRRPERFSDSRQVNERHLDRSQLEYHLDTITSRNEETRFADFARRIAERAICPNLLPQTGPTGGGDSKVDSETIPVADALASLWAGFPREAAEERWAFAFSAKKKWKEKAQSDVEKVAATDRGYAKAFFVSNQFIPDKQRAQLEDQLRTKHGLDVRLLDRNWLLDQVFQRNLEAVAVEALGLPAAYVPTTRHGPGDIEKTVALEKLTERLETAVREGRWTPALVDDARDAATLSRDLERPRADVEALFSRAQEYAARCGTPTQRFLVTYDKAWTAYWWHEDAALAERLYGELEVHAADSENVFELELLTNVWTITGVAGLKSGTIPEAHKARTDRLLAILARFEGRSDRPSSALQARTLRLHTQLQLSARTDPTPTLRELMEVVDEAERYSGFPLEPILRIVEELGDFLGALPAYSDLFDKVVEVRARRSGELEAGRLLVRRGAQHLRVGRFTEAIRSLGKALRRLNKDESRVEATRALSMCAHAYAQLGLLWAARGTAIAAAALAIRELSVYGRLSSPQVACSEQVKWIELRLGRLPQTLAWHEVERMLAAATGTQPTADEHDDTAYDALLAMTLLDASTDELRHLSRLPPVLERLDLHASELTLKFALGDEQPAREAFSHRREPASSDGEFLQTMVAWRDSPARAQVRAGLSLGLSRKLQLESPICGVRVRVATDNDRACLAVAESILGALEGLLATGLADRLHPREPEIPIRVRHSDFVEPPFSCEVIISSGRPTLEVCCASFDPSSLGVADQSKFQKALFAATSSILAHGFFTNDVEQTLERLFGDDEAQDRAIFAAGNPLSAAQVVGTRPRTSIDAWFMEGAAPTELTRSSRWDSDLEGPPTGAPIALGSPAESESIEPRPKSQPVDVRHDSIRVVSVIRVALWDAARWRGTGYEVRPNQPPTLFFVFENAEPAKQIFDNWGSELGPDDRGGRLRITFIRGVDRKAPASYRVVVSPDLSQIATVDSGQMGTVMALTRTNTMEPPTSTNLDRFLSSHRRFGECRLEGAVADEGGAFPRPLDAFSLRVTNIAVREAWEIARHDLELVGLHPDDDPVRPDGRASVPVDEVLAWLRGKERST